MPEQTIDSIREQIRMDRDDEAGDRKGHLKGLPSGDPRLEWTLRIAEGHPVLSLRRIGSAGRIGFIQPHRDIWHGTVCVDGELVVLECRRPQPSRVDMASHLYGLAIQMLNMEDGADESHAEVQDEGGGASGAGEAGSGDSRPVLEEPIEGGAAVPADQAGASVAGEGDGALSPGGLVDAEKEDGLK